MSPLTNETARDDAELARAVGSRHHAVFWQVSELTGCPPTPDRSNGIH
jgi:hypothetical protein